MRGYSEEQFSKRKDDFSPVSGTFALQNGCSKRFFGQYCWGVLEHDAFHRAFRQSQVENDISAQSFGENPDPVIPIDGDVVQRVLVARHELTNRNTTMFWHNAHIISSQVYVIAQLGKDIRMTARSLRNQDSGSVLPLFKVDEFKLLAARRESSSLHIPFNLVRVCFKNIILFPVALFHGSIFPSFSSIRLSPLYFSGRRFNAHPFVLKLPSHSLQNLLRLTFARTGTDWT